MPIIFLYRFFPFTPQFLLSIAAAANRNPNVTIQEWLLPKNTVPPEGCTVTHDTAATAIRRGNKSKPFATTHCSTTTST